MIWLDNSRILAIFAVVLLHTAANIVIGNDIGTYNWWIGNIYDSAVRWCVPVFVMISGALLLDGNKNESLTIFYKKRASKIIPPIIFWTIIYLIYNALKDIIGGNTVSIASLLMTVVLGSPYYHMWFLYMIIFLYLFTPFIRKITKTSSPHEILLIVVLSFGIAIINSAVNLDPPSGQSIFINWFLPYIPYFILGNVIATSKIAFSKIILFTIFIASITTTILGCYILSVRQNLDVGLYFYDYLSITVIPMSISLMLLFKSWNTPILTISITKKLSSLTLGIYLIHPIVLESMRYFYLKRIAISAFIYIPCTALLVFVISLGAVWIMAKIPLIKRII